MMESASELQKIIDKCVRMEEALKEIYYHSASDKNDGHIDKYSLLRAFADCKHIAKEALLS